MNIKYKCGMFIRLDMDEEMLTISLPDSEDAEEAEECC